MVPRSHHLHSELVLPHRKRDFVRFGANDPRLAGLGDARLVCGRAGDLILWDSRTVHASAPADASSPLPREIDGRPRLSRAACMICMVPAPTHLARRPSLPLERMRLIERACTTTHWPQESKVTSQGPPGAGVGHIRHLPPEARALVLGASCEKRRAYRAQWTPHSPSEPAGPACAPSPPLGPRIASDKPAQGQGS